VREGKGETVVGEVGIQLEKEVRVLAQPRWGWAVGVAGVEVESGWEREAWVVE
jgi:hypothetical protein